MRKIILFLLLIAIVSFDTPKQDAYDTGEWFKFRIHYGFVNAGYATLEVKDAVVRAQTTLPKWGPDLQVLGLPRVLRTVCPTMSCMRWNLNNGCFA